MYSPIKDEKSLQTLVHLWALVEKGYVAGTALHIAKPEQSVFRVMTDAEYRSSSIADIQNILRTRHILITHRPESEHQFDKEGLRTLRTNFKDGFKVQGLVDVPFLQSSAHPSNRPIPAY